MPPVAPATHLLLYTVKSNQNCYVPSVQIGTHWHLDEQLHKLKGAIWMMMNDDEIIGWCGSSQLCTASITPWKPWSKVFDVKSKLISWRTWDFPVKQQPNWLITRYQRRSAPVCHQSLQLSSFLHGVYFLAERKMSATSVQEPTHELHEPVGLFSNCWLTNASWIRSLGGPLDGLLGANMM